MKSVFRPFPLPLTGRQKFYLFVLQGLGAGLIDGGANFGIAYAMYGKQEVVKMWIFSQNTIAGDLGVTPIVQCLASMIISSTLVHTDLHNSKIRPLAFCYPHVEDLPDPRSLFGKRDNGHGKLIDAKKGVSGSSSDHRDGGDEVTIAGSPPASGTGSISDEKRHQNLSPSSPTSSLNHRGLAYYYWMLIRFIFEGTEQNMLLAKPGFGAWFGRLGWTALQGAAIGIVFGFPIWCLAIVILTPIYGMGNMGSTWAPQIIKCVYGAVVGWVTNPVIAVLALGSQAEQSLIVVQVDEEAEAEAGSGRHGGRAIEEAEERQEELADDFQGVETIPEDDVLSPPPQVLSADQAGFSSRRHSAASSRFANLTRPHSPSTAFNPLSSPHRANYLPSPNRSRAGSASSSLRSPSIHTRPPLTANTSFLAPLPSPSPLDRDRPASGYAPPSPAFASTSGNRLRARSAAQPPTSTSVSLAPPIQGDDSQTFGTDMTASTSRQRGATISNPTTAPPSTSPELPYPSTPKRLADTPRSFSYALGGTGGRAQRSRSRSSSTVSQIPPLSLVGAAAGAPAPVGSAATASDGEKGVRTAGPGADAAKGKPERVWDLFGRKE